MEVHFADSFYKSLKVLIRHETWWYKTYEFFRYDIYRFFKNIYLFRKELYNFHAWEYSFNLRLFQKSLVLTADNLEKNGWEEDVSRGKKVKAIRRVVELLEHVINDDFLEQTEKELGVELKLSKSFWKNEPIEEDPVQEEINKKIINRSTEIEQQQWDELWFIIKGNPMFFYKNLDENLDDKNWEEKFDGSDIRSWWD